MHTAFAMLLLGKLDNPQQRLLLPAVSASKDNAPAAIQEAIVITVALDLTYARIR